VTTYRNPVVRGIAPDPSIVRVGDDYYLASSTMEYLPGIVIRHSTDLVNWQIIGAAVTRPAQYRRDGEPGEIMLYAPTLRYAEGTFYVACTNVADGQGNFVVRTTDPSGPWSDALWIDSDAFDPSLLYDDGTWYYTRRTLAPLPDGRLGPVVQAVIDLDTGKLGPLRELTPDYGGFCSNDIEGPHLYHVGDWYYLFSAEGGTGKCHMQTVARSRSPWGPFDPAPHNPVLTHRNRVGHPIQSLGHADLVEAADGSWRAVALGTRHESRGGFVQHHNLGRETFLLPVELVDGWPVIGRDGTTELLVDLDRALPSAPQGAVDRPPVVHGWSTLADTPAPRIDADDGSIVVPAGGTAYLAQTEDAQTFTASIPDGAPAGAGIAVVGDADHRYTLTVRGSVAGLVRVVDDLTVSDTVEIGTGPHRLEIVATAEDYAFSVDGRRLARGRARLLSAESAESFIGCRFALVGGDSQDATFVGVTRKDA
jgi:alpha-N-arabinofuranosidase